MMPPAGVRHHAEAAGLFDRDRGRHAVAEVRGISEHLPARITGVARRRSEIRGRRRRVEVVERLRQTSGEAGELDERAVAVEGVAGRIVEVQAELEVGTKGAVLGLLPAIEPGISTGPHRKVLAVGAGLETRDVGERSIGHARTVVVGIFGPDISADLQADVGARDVVEAIPVQGADFDVLHRLRLHRHVRGLCPSDRDESRGGTEEKTSHHLHLNLHLLSWEGSVSVGRCSPWKVPFSSPHQPAFPLPSLSPE